MTRKRCVCVCGEEQKSMIPLEGLHRVCIKKSPIRAQPRHESSAKKGEPCPPEPVLEYE